MFEARLGPRLRVGDLAPPAGFLSNVDPAPDEILRDSEVWAALSTSYIYMDYGPGMLLSCNWQNHQIEEFTKGTVFVLCQMG